MTTKVTFDALDKTNAKYKALQKYSMENHTKVSNNDYAVTTTPTPNFFWYNAIHLPILPSAKRTLASTLGTATHALVDILANYNPKKKTKNTIGIADLLDEGAIPIQVEVAFAIIRELKKQDFKITKRDLTKPINEPVFGVELFADLFVEKLTGKKKGIPVVCEIKTSWNPEKASADINVDKSRTHREQALMGALGMGDKYGALGIVVKIPPVRHVATINVQSIYYSPEKVQELRDIVKDS